MTGYIVQVNNVTRTFPNGGTAITALREVSFLVGRGEQVAVIGPSGSGKTTLLGLIGALDRPDSGSITCLDTAISALSEKDAASFRRQHVGFIFQDNALMEELTIEENVELPLVLQHTDRSTSNKKVREMLAAVGLANRLHALPAGLSAGEKQRVAVARAIIHQPDILLADEPTANLDAASAETVLGSIATLARDRTMTVILATHDPRVYERFPRIIRLSDGRLANTA